VHKQVKQVVGEVLICLRLPPLPLDLLDQVKDQLEVDLAYLKWSWHWFGSEVVHIAASQVVAPVVCSASKSDSLY
jgi:hypothetical protein